MLISILSTAEIYAQYYFNEDTGLVVVEVESVSDIKGWKLKEATINDREIEYLVWEGNQYLGSPGNQLLEYRIKINTPGTYRFIWNCKVGHGTSNTEHNDSWLRIPDAADYYGEKPGDIVHPHGICTNDCPNGAGSAGWFKIYSSGTTDWTWSTRTSDHDAHQIYARFDTAGIYTVQISARSTYHQLNRFVMYHLEKYSEPAVNKLSLPQSSTIPFAPLKPQVMLRSDSLYFTINSIHEEIDTIIYDTDNTNLISSIEGKMINETGSSSCVIKLYPDESGEATIFVNAIDNSKDTFFLSFPLLIIPYINQPPQIDPIPDQQVDMADGAKGRVKLTGLSDGNEGVETLFFDASIAHRIVTSLKVYYTQGEDTAILEFDIRATGEIEVQLEISDNGGLELGGKNTTVASFNLSVINTTAIKNTDNNNIPAKIYPNPVNDRLFLTTNPALQTQYQIIDQHGRIVLSGNITENEYPINVSALSKESYCLRLISVAKSESIVFIKH